jgi:hypothetical protein
MGRAGYRDLRKSIVSMKPIMTWDKETKFLLTQKADQRTCRCRRAGSRVFLCVKKWDRDELHLRVRCREDGEELCWCFSEVTLQGEQALTPNENSLTS